MKRRWLFILLLLQLYGGSMGAAEPDETARPIPATRPEMKQLLEDMKSRTVRLPLPEPTAAEKEQLGGTHSAGSSGRSRAAR